jgi:hypothetical protein
MESVNEILKVIFFGISKEGKLIEWGRSFMDVMKNRGPCMEP